MNNTGKSLSHWHNVLLYLCEQSTHVFASVPIMSCFITFYDFKPGLSLLFSGLIHVKSGWFSSLQLYSYYEYQIILAK